MLHFLIVDSICVDQDRTLSTYMPRSFSFVEMSIVSLPIFSVGGLAKVTGAIRTIGLTCPKLTLP